MLYSLDELLDMQAEALEEGNQGFAEELQMQIDELLMEEE